MPKDFEIDGEQEQLTATVTYETQKLYGRVTAKHTITIVSSLESEPFPFAINSAPVDGVMVSQPRTTLSWHSGAFAVSHDLYIGTAFDDVNNGVEGTFVGNLTTNSCIIGHPDVPIPGGLIPGTTYYWRVDEINDVNPASPWKGDVWSFWIPSRTAFRPNPVDEQANVFTDVTLSWTPGCDATSHYAYFGENFDDVSNATGGAQQTSATYTPASLELNQTYYWRVDEVDTTGALNKGNVWSFSTIPSDIPVLIDDPNIEGYWPLNEGAGRAVLDRSSKNNHGRFSGNVQWINGIERNALEFTGGQYIDCGVKTGQNITGDFTFSVWVKLAPNTTDYYGGIGGKFMQSEGLYTGFVLIRHRSNFFRLWVGDETDDVIKSGVSSDQPYTDTMWHHVAGVREGQVNMLYIDGVKQTQTTSTNFVPSTDSFHIGRQFSHRHYRYWKGLIDEVRVYSRALSGAEIQASMRINPLQALTPTANEGAQ